MSLAKCMGAALLLCAAISISGCGSLPAKGENQYRVGAGSAIFAGSPLPEGEALTAIDLYFGHHMVRPAGPGRGCCYQAAMGFVNSGKPRGGLLAIWTAHEYGDEKAYSETFDEWYRKPVRNRYYYAAVNPSAVARYPSREAGHRFYGIYVSAGKVVVSAKGLRPEDAEGATELPPENRKPRRYVFGREDTLYYKKLSHGRNPTSVADHTSIWHTIPGVALTEAQYKELEDCSPIDDCRWYLSLDDPDLTTEQREYVLRNPFSPADMKPLIKRMERHRRMRERWL